MTTTEAQRRAVAAAQQRMKEAGDARKTYVIRAKAYEKLEKLVARSGMSATTIINTLILDVPLSRFPPAKIDDTKNRTVRKSVPKNDKK